MSTNFWLELDGQTVHVGKANTGSPFVWQGYLRHQSPVGEPLMGAKTWETYLHGILGPHRITDDHGAPFSAFDLMDRVKALRRFEPRPSEGALPVNADLVRYGEWK